MDRGEKENELRQILGDMRDAVQVGPEDILLVGTEGVLFAGPHATQHEYLLLDFCALLSRQMFLRILFVRMLILDKDLSECREVVQVWQSDPENIEKMRSLLNQTSKDVILFGEVLQYFMDAMHKFKMPKIPDDDDGRRLYEALKLQ
jgi:hypothetical protein